MKQFFLDKAGLFVTCTCFLHCLLLPLLLPILPLVSLQWIADPAFEKAVLMLSIVIAVAAILNGYHRHHRRLHPMLFIVAGIVFYACKDQWGHEYEVWFLGSGAFLIMLGHAINLRLSLNSKAATA
ncbi:MAG: MerC domain-containing protein [Salinisphaeraceae bacterium]|nr:MerC domain-containing protein [Salinisphaeraceae bacterium]